MAKQVRLYQLEELSHDETPSEVLLDTHLNTELHIIKKEFETIIKFPYGNKFDIIDGMIIIHEKK